MEQKQKQTMYERMKQSVKSAFVGAAIGFAVAGSGGCDHRAVSVMQDSGMQDSYKADIMKPDSGVQKPDTWQVTQDSGIKPDTLQQPDSGVPPQYSYTVKNLIGDYLDRELLDRGKGLTGYPLASSETSSNSNPFADGAGGNIGVSKTDLHRIDGNMFPPFANVTLSDHSAARNYSEFQDLWVSGNSHYSDAANGVIGKINDLTYSIKFKGMGDDLGIPVCTTPTNNVEYANCNIDYQTASHKLFVKFLGEDWLITKTVPPAYTNFSNETTIITGGEVKLAREAASAILNVLDSLHIDNLKFQLDDVEDHNTGGSAIISVFDSTGNFLKKEKVDPGSTKEMLINGKTYRFHVWKTTPGYPTGAKWADVSVFSHELKLQSGQPLDHDNGNNKYWYVYLGWKNKGGSASDTQPDHLRTIVLHADDISSLSSGGTNELKPGDYIPIPQDPVGFTFGYKGLSNGNHSSLKADLEKSNYMIVQSNGPLDSSGKRVQCTITAPYVKVVSSATGHVFTVDNIKGAGVPTSAYNNEFYVATSGANCGGSIGKLDKGTLFMVLPNTAVSIPSWGYLDYSTNGMYVKFPQAGDGSSDPMFGGSFNYLMAGSPEPYDASFVVVQRAGEGVSKDTMAGQGFALKLAGASSTFNFDAPLVNTFWYKKDYVTYYNIGGPVSSCSSQPNSGCLFEEGFIDERGSQFVQKTDTLIEVNVAGQLVYSQFYLAKK